MTASQSLIFVFITGSVSDGYLIDSKILIISRATNPKIRLFLSTLVTFYDYLRLLRKAL